MGHKFRGSTPLLLATIFSFILDSNKLNKIKEKYDCDNIEQQLVDGTMLDVFEEGFKK